MIRKFNKKIKQRLEQIGFHVRKASSMRPLDMSDEKDVNPLGAFYLANGRPVLIQVPLVKCLTLLLLAFPADRAGKSPFIRTLVSFEDGQCKHYKGSILESYYKSFKPKSPTELLGIEEKRDNVLAELPPIGAPVVWSPEFPQRRVERVRQSIRDHNQVKEGVRLGEEGGHPYFGPVLPLKGELQFQRLTRVFESIKKSGFKFDKRGINNIEAICLTSGDSWKFFIVSGNHRVSALAALGYKYATVQLRRQEGIGGIVRREDVELWPVVMRGYLTKSEALDVFDRIFAGEQPFGVPDPETNFQGTGRLRKEISQHCN